MTIKNIFSLATSIISLFIITLFFINSSKSDENNIKYYSKDEGILSVMYHRFNESKYPSTNIQMDIFKKHIDIIKNSNFNFQNPINFEEQFKIPKLKKNILITIDDAFESFYKNAWPILKKREIPFILFVSTREVNKHGYMTWEQIIELQKNSLVTIGNHSHSHEYLIDWDDNKIKLDLEKSIKIFKDNMGYAPKIFSYPFGEYSSNLKKIVSNLKFEFAFGQHSGVIDATKDFLELPRFPINEKYGELKRFKSILQTLPFPYKKILPENKYITKDENPPRVKIKFFENLINIKNINCYSNEGNIWRKSKIDFINNYEINIILEEKFKSERGRINCSLQEKDKWRWLGIQYVIAEY